MPAALSKAVASAAVGGALVLLGVALARQRRSRPRAATSAAAGAPTKKPTPPDGGFRRKALPAPCVGMSSQVGRQLFSEALAQGMMEVFFPLIETFHTQAEATFCGLGTLVNILNALEVDPGELGVSGVWRWYNEWMLDCCVEIDEIQTKGLIFDQWVCLAACQGLDVSSVRAEETSIEEFRSTVARVCAQRDSMLCVSYSRKVLGQTGDGHYSPVGGYHTESDQVLVLDVARFKYPPHWVPLQLLWDAMLSVDKDTGRSRGYATLSRPATNAGLACLQLIFGRKRMEALHEFLNHRLTAAVQGTSTLEEELWSAVRAIPPQVASLLKVRSPSEASEVGEGAYQDLVASLRGSALHAAFQAAAAAHQARVGPPPIPLLDATALFLTMGDMLRPVLPKVWEVIESTERAAPASMTNELSAAREILTYMGKESPNCSTDCCKAQPS